jgi:ankyrin repeat protein
MAETDLYHRLCQLRSVRNVMRQMAPLHKAASSGHQAVVEVLLANKAVVNAKANDERTPLI